MPIQGAKPVRLTSSGGITLRSASGIHRVPGNRNLPNDFIRRQHEIDLDEVPRFARCGADGRQRGVGAGSIVFRLAAISASASAGGNTSARSGSGRKTQADGGAAQGK